MRAQTWSVRLSFELGRRAMEAEADQVERRAGKVAGETAVAVRPRTIDVSFWVDGSWTDATVVAEQVARRLRWTPVEVVVRTQAVVEAELAHPQLPDLVGTRQIAEQLDVTRQRVLQLQDHPGFPRALVHATGTLWDRRAIDRFARDWHRRGRRRAPVDKGGT